MKKTLSVLLVLALLCLIGCTAQTPQDTPLTTSAEEVAERLNAAVEMLAAAESYRIFGNVTSTAEVIPAGSSSGEVVTLRTPLLTAVRGEEFSTVSDGGDLPHSAYFDGENYYIDLGEGETALHYRTSGNDYCDYPATAYLKAVNAEAVFDPTVTQAEGGGCMLTFDIPCALYDSEAVYGWLGEYLDEAHAAQTLHLSLSIDAEGYPTALYLFFSTQTQLGDDTIRQELAVSLSLYDFGEAVPTPPDDLSVYENWDTSVPTDDEQGFAEIPPEDLG